MRYIGKITGKVEAALLCDIPGSIASSRKDSIQADLEGLVGDRHLGHTFPSNGRYPEFKRGTEIRNSRQVSIISVEEMQIVAEMIAIPLIQPEWLGANLLISGIPALTLLPPSSRLFFASGAVLVVHGENDPCSHPGGIIQKNFPEKPKLSPAFIAAAVHRRGVVAWVEKPGIILSGEAVTAEIPEQFDYSQYLPK